MVVSIIPLITCPTMDILFPLQPHPPSSLSLTFLSEFPYFHFLCLCCSTSHISSLPSFLVFHTHHPAFMPPLLSSSSRVSSEVLITTFSTISMLFPETFLPQSSVALLSPFYARLSLIYFASLKLIYFFCSKILIYLCT